MATNRHYVFSACPHTVPMAAARRLLRGMLEHLMSTIAPGPGLVPQHAVSNSSVRLHTTLAAAREIRQLRNRARLTQREFAACLGVSESQLVQMEIGDAGCLQTLRACRLAHAAIDCNEHSAKRNEPASAAIARHGVAT